MKRFFWRLMMILSFFPLLALFIPYWLFTGGNLIQMADKYFEDKVK